jgi:hypothetical protein
MESRRLQARNFTWQLEAAVWVAKCYQEGDEDRCRPRLYLVCDDWNQRAGKTTRDVIGYIEYDLGGKHIGQARWMFHYYPEDGSELWESRDENKWSMGRAILKHGEISQPGDSAESVLKRLLELAKDDIPPMVYTALEKVSGVHLSSLKQIVDMYIRRYGAKKPPVEA